MTGVKLLAQIDLHMKQIFRKFEIPFVEKEMIFCGDLHQLPAVHQLLIYKQMTLNFMSDTVWQTLDYCPLDQVMRSQIFPSRAY